MRAYTVKQVMNKSRVKILDEYDTVLTAVTHMDKENISALPVKSKEGQYVGVISKTDIASLRFLKMIQGKNAEQLYVKDLMNRVTPFYVMETQPISDAIAIMHKHHFHRVFVSDSQHKICGIVSTTDVIKLLFIEQ